MNFNETQTHITLLQIYGAEYSQKSTNEQEQFYSELLDEDQFKIKFLTTKRIGYGYNKIVINEDPYRVLNNQNITNFNEFTALLMQNFLKTKKQHSKDEQENIKQPPNQIFDKFITSLNYLSLPPQGIAIACISAENFIVPTLIQLSSLLALTAERRYKYLTKQLFPLKISQKTQNDEIILENVPDFQHTNPTNLTALSTSYKRFLNLQHDLLQGEIWSFATSFAATKPQQNYSIFEHSESLLPLFLDPQYDVKLDPGMLTGWIVVNGPVDWSENLFKGNWKGIFPVIEEFVAVSDRKFYELVEEVMGVQYVKGW